MDTIKPEQLVTVNLKFGISAQPLKVIAFADLASKALFLLNKPSSVLEIASQVASILGIAQVEEILISEALLELRSQGKVKIISEDQWDLADGVKGQIETEINNSEVRINDIIARHFPTSISATVLKQWFIEATADFFGYNGAELVASICKNTKTPFRKQTTIKDLLSKSIKKYSLREHEDILLNGFTGFLLSEDSRDQTYFMSLALSMFSAQLVAADVGTDPITLNELKDATFILDTNILFPIQLDVTALAASIKPLALALSKIGAKVVYLQTTKEEHGRVIDAKRTEILGVLEEFPSELFENVEDDFIATAKHRGCKDQNDFRNFFNNLSSIPNKIAGVIKLKLLDHSEINEVTKKAGKDNELKGSVQSYNARLRYWRDPKSESALKHDAGLIYVVEYLRKTNPKTWVVTLDRSLQACASQRAGAHEIPAVIVLEGLIQILAIYNGGPQQDAANFAPLLRNIILKRCNPVEHTYTIQDLHWLHSIQERVTDLPNGSIERLAKIVMQHRLAGTFRDKKFQLEINRAFQQEKLNVAAELVDAKQRVREAESVSSEEKQKAKIAQKERVIAEEKTKLLYSMLWRIPLTIILTLVLAWLMSITLAEVNKGSLMGYITDVIGFWLLGWQITWRRYASYREEVGRISNS